jgi:N-acetyltransferase 10
MASTIHGYEGTGRSLSLKLINQLRQQSVVTDTKSKSATSSRILKEVKLEHAIRYADGDEVEAWLNKLLVLGATDCDPINDGYPHPSELELYSVNRDTLFSFHKASESFLYKIMSLFVSSHYKNSPNDLQLLSDAPAHSIFVLCKPIDKSSGKSIPDIYAAIQTCEEGGIDKTVILNNNKRGQKPAGDLIPWTISEHYQDNEFPKMTGIRVVRIATHPDCHRMGYGTRALDLLSEFYEGKMINLEEYETNKQDGDNNKNENEGDEIKPRKKLKPLLCKLSEMKPNFVYYLGTAFGLTRELFGFWKKSGFHPLYLKLTENDITGEHSCIMIKPIREEDIKHDEDENNTKQKWLTPFLNDFRKRLVSLLGYDLKTLSINLALSLLDPQLTSTTNTNNNNDDEKEDSNAVTGLTKCELDTFISKYDFKRMELYTKNLVKYQMIIDLLPFLAKFFFLKKFPNVKLAFLQAAILLGFGLQYKSFDSISEELNKIGKDQLLGFFNKMIKKFTTSIRQIYEKELDKDKTQISNISLPINEKLDLDLHEDLKAESEKIKKHDKAVKQKYHVELNKKRLREDKK